MKATCKQYQKREEKVGIPALGRKEARKDYEYINSLYSPPLLKRGWIMARPRRRRVSRSNTREYNRGKVDWTGLLKEALRRHSVALDGRNPRIALGKFAWFEIRLIRHSCSLPLDSLWNGFARGYRGMQSRDKDWRLGVIIRSSGMIRMFFLFSFFPSIFLSFFLSSSTSSSFIGVEVR